MTTRTPKTIRWSPQQADFLKFAQEENGSCVLEAVAGAGKTTTILEAACTMRGGVAILAFNKKIADEIKGKLAERGVDFRKAEAGTVHSFGFRAFRKTFEHVRLDEEKVPGMVDLALPPEWDHLRSGIVTLIGLAKQAAIGVLTAIDSLPAWMHLADHHDVFGDVDQDEDFDLAAIVAFCIRMLRENNRETGRVDYDDMVYLPLVHRVRFWRYDVVMIDEAQDTNGARRALVRALVRPGGRVIAVGDARQAIYGFTGADADALDQIARDFSARRMPLTVTYRCPKAIVEFARQWVSHIEAHESAPQGEVMNLTAEQFVREHVHAGKLDARSAILCRNTKPIVALAFRLIAAGVACRVEGREIGAGLKKLASRWKRVRSTAALRERLEAFLEREMTKLLAAGKEARAQEVDDKVQTLIAIIEYCESKGQTTLKDVEARIDELFEDKVTGLLVLSTIHKSKGREWPTVYWLDRKGTCPSPYARKDWQIGQEANLCYVAATRAQERLIEIPAIKTLALPEKAAEPAAKAAA